MCSQILIRTEWLNVDFAMGNDSINLHIKSCRLLQGWLVKDCVVISYYMEQFTLLRQMLPWIPCLCSRWNLEWWEIQVTKTPLIASSKLWSMRYVDSFSFSSFTVPTNNSPIARGAEVDAFFYCFQSMLSPWFSIICSHCPLDLFDIQVKSETTSFVNIC